MNTGIRFLLFCIFVSVSPFTFAASVTVFMCQEDSAANTVRASTAMIESGVMGALFDCGHIVSSELTAQKTAGSDIGALMNQALQSSAETFFEFVVQITVRYAETVIEDTEKIVFADIRSVDWCVVHTQNKNCIGERYSVIPKKNKGETDMEALERFAREIGSAIEKTIRERR